MGGALVTTPISRYAGSDDEVTYMRSNEVMEWHHEEYDRWSNGKRKLIDSLRSDNKTFADKVREQRETIEKLEAEVYDAAVATGEAQKKAREQEGIHSEALASSKRAEQYYRDLAWVRSKENGGLRKTIAELERETQQHKIQLANQSGTIEHYRNRMNHYRNKYEEADKQWNRWRDKCQVLADKTEVPIVPKKVHEKIGWLEADKRWDKIIITKLKDEKSAVIKELNELKRWSANQASTIDWFRDRMNHWREKCESVPKNPVDATCEANACLLDLLSNERADYRAFFERIIEADATLRQRPFTGDWGAVSRTAQEALDKLPKP